MIATRPFSQKRTAHVALLKQFGFSASYTFNCDVEHQCEARSTRPEEKTSTSAKGLYSTFGLNQRGFQRFANHCFNESHHEVDETALDFPDHIADPNHAGLNDLRIDAAQVKLFPQR